MTSSRGGSLGMDQSLPRGPRGLSPARPQSDPGLADRREPDRGHLADAFQVALDSRIEALHVPGARRPRAEPRTQRHAVKEQMKMADTALQRPSRQGEHVPYRLHLRSQNGELYDPQARGETAHANRPRRASLQHA